MSLFSVFRRPLATALPALLLVAACSSKDDPIIPAPDVAHVLAVHAAVNNSTRPIKVTVGDKVGAPVAYGTFTAYQTVDVGNKPLLVDIDAQGGARLYGTAATFAKDKYYSFFAYSAPGQSTATVSGLLAEDDLTAPASGMAKVRLVHVGQDLESPLTLSKVPGNGGALAPVTAAVAAGQASPFVQVPAGTASYNLANSSNSATQPVNGGSVLGTSFVAGKIYSIVVQGSMANAPTNAERFTLTLITHN